MHDPTSSQHQDGLLRAIQLCEKFINANAASMEAYSVLKEEVAKAMLAQQQVKPALWQRSKASCQQMPYTDDAGPHTPGHSICCSWETASEAFLDHSDKQLHAFAVRGLLQGKARPQAASPSKTGSFKAGAYSPTSSQKAAKGRVASAQQQQRAAEDIFSASPVSKAPGQLALTTAAMIHRRAKPVRIQQAADLLVPVQGVVHPQQLG